MWKEVLVSIVVVVVIPCAALPLLLAQNKLEEWFLGG